LFKTNSYGFPIVQKFVNFESKYFGTDNPNTNKQFKKDFSFEFDYKFNSWGYRGPDYTQYLGKPVYICLGDSAVVNIGGPIEHSWCSQLADNFDIPVLNFGVIQGSNDSTRYIYEKVCNLFDVQDIFVQYTYFHRRLQNNKPIQVVCSDDENFKFFKNHYINGAHETAVANWSFSKEEQNFLKFNKIYMFEPEYYYADYKDLVDSNRKLYTIESNYKNLQSDEWPSYEEFCNGAEPHPDMYTKQFGYVLNDIYLSTNRDMIHFSKEVNKKYANVFYMQWKQKHES